MTALLFIGAFALGLGLGLVWAASAPAGPVPGQLTRDVVYRQPDPPAWTWRERPRAEPAARRRP